MQNPETTRLRVIGNGETLHAVHQVMESEAGMASPEFEQWEYVDIVEFLSNHTAFSSLSRAEINQLAPHVEIRTLQPNDFLVRKGEVGCEMFIVRRGLFEVQLTDASDDVKVVRYLEEGALIGEMAIMTQQTRLADVVAINESTVIVFSLDILTPLLKQHPKLACFITELLITRIKYNASKGIVNIVGKYELLKQLGSGASSFVYEGVQNGLGRLVAIKMLSHSLVFHGCMIRRFQEEAKLVARLNHPNIVQIYDTEDAFGTHFIIMEKVNGPTLAELLAKHGPFHHEEARQYITQLCRALAYAQGLGIVHRDVKPSNCALMQNGSIKLMDFGLAQFQEEIRAIHGVAEGSPFYMAPEVISGKDYDYRSDIYSVGITAYQLLTGEVPFPYKTVEQIYQAHMHGPVPSIRDRLPNLPDDLAKFIELALIKDPEQRISNWKEIFTLLGERFRDRQVCPLPQPIRSFLTKYYNALGNH